MSKALMVLSFLSLVILAVGTAKLHNNQIFLLASDSNLYQYIREVLASVMFLQLVTHPPRHIAFRMLAGAVAIGVVGWAVVQSYDGIMPFLDTFSLLASASAIGVTALEVNQTSRQKIGAARSSNPLIA